jgi:hypothetical protein
MSDLLDWQAFAIRVRRPAMEQGRVEDLRIQDEIGCGGCGRVFHMEGNDGVALALKVFDDSSINRKLLIRSEERLRDGGWPAGVLEVIEADYAGKPAFRMGRMLADRRDDGTWAPRSLQHRLDEHPGVDSWKLVKSMATALAGMHQRRVPHGNLKPGNVYLENDGGVMLSDWALGNMPGVHEFHFTDAVLYQAPEQLQGPDGSIEQAGFRWDVFAFGVLAFRILTGQFPRCHKTFAYVAPPQGETRREGLKADLKKIAANLIASPDPSWPDDPRNPLEAGLRGWIDRCLEIEPSHRPATMVEVAAGFAAVENELSMEKERLHLMDQRRAAERRAVRSLFALGAAAAVAVVFAGLWHLSNTRLKLEKSQRFEEARTLKAAAEAAMDSRVTAETRRVRAEQALAYERELWLARLESSRQIGDRLFSWAMEKGHRRLPALDGRELRLKRLERYYEDFLTRSSDLPGLEDERARSQLQLAEIALAAGDATAATSRLAAALDAWANLPMDPDWKLRMATNSLMLALLRQERSDPGTEAAFTSARRALDEVPRSSVDADRLDQLFAILDFHEAKLLAARGDDTRALEQLMRSTQALNRIADQRPDAAVLRAELAACYLSSATILEGMGSLGDAREVRTLAANELTKLLKASPGDPALQLELAGCYGAMAEAAVLSGDVAGAETLSGDALKLLDAVLASQPDHAAAVARKAAQLGLRAGIKRDRGLAAEAIKDFDEGIRMLEALRVSSPDDAMVSYRLALLWWQKGRMLGMGGKRDDEISLILKSRALLGELEAAEPTDGPRPEQLQRSTAYLCGDLGHALQLAGRKEEAARAFSDAVALWQSLNAARPQSEEYSEGLAWCKQRLEDVK